MPDANGNWTLTDLTTIRAAIASGAMRVEYNDRTVVYKSMNELLQAEQKIMRALGMVKKGGNRLLCKSSKGTC
jgi:hypothetical protein